MVVNGGSEQERRVKCKYNMNIAYEDVQDDGECSRLFLL